MVNKSTSKLLFTHTTLPVSDTSNRQAAQVAPPATETSAWEQFRATARLVFLAPDVPPVQPKQRRNELRKLDELLDYRFSRGRDRREPWQNRRGSDAKEPFDREDALSSREEQELADDASAEDAARVRRRNRRRNGLDRQSAAAEEATDASQHSARSHAATRQSGEESRFLSPAAEPQKVKGSTRLESKKQRRRDRDGRELGRHRKPVITESEFLARRESVDRELIVRQSDDRIQIAVTEDRVLVEHYVARSNENSLIGNVYLGQVQNVLPGMEAAFVDIGKGRNAVLYSGEVDWSEFEGSVSTRRIEQAMKPGDQVLVQVTKDPVGHKGARLTSQISLPGRFLVYLPGGTMNGISRKLPDTERARLKKILKEALPGGASVIVRTAAEGAREDQVIGDVQHLSRQWEKIRRRAAEGSNGPLLLHSESDTLIKIVRDVVNEDFRKVVVQGEETYQVIVDYLAQMAPELLDRVERYEAADDIFDECRLNEQIIKALDRNVWLPSGGSLVIDRTEAMTVVDVNTGKFVGSGGNLEETVTKNNLEAAEEIVRQLRLRDIGGIIVIDFIDMVLESNRDLVLMRLIECLSRDRTKHQVSEITSLGLVQMTRKKLGLGLLESFSEPCAACAGRGVIVQHDPVARQRAEVQPRSKRGGVRQSPASVQPNKITDKSRSALAKIAASTIAASSETPTAEDTPADAETPTTAETQTAAETLVTEIADGRAGDIPQINDVDGLLGSVLNALPAAPASGMRRRAHRRASTAKVFAEAAETPCGDARSMEG